MNSRIEKQFEWLMEVCKTFPNFKVAFMIRTYARAEYLLRSSKLDNCKVNFVRRTIDFDNGSVLYLKHDTNIQGWEIDRIVYDEVAEFKL